jgi:hypothetical protein
MYIGIEDFMSAMVITVSSRGGFCMQIPGWRYISEKKDMNESLLARYPCYPRTPIASSEDARMHAHVNFRGLDS